jgi:hypothetical protein
VGEFLEGNQIAHPFFIGCAGLHSNRPDQNLD